MAAPQETPKQGPISDNDVEEWKARFNDVLARPSEHVNQKSPPNAQPWYNSLFACFSPIDLCLITCCIPCVTFGKTHHRLRKNGSLEGYEPINTSCLLFCGSSCVGATPCLMAMQKADIRARYNLQGNCLVDLATACCCGCCDLIQQDKEAAYRTASASGQAGGPIEQQYQPPTEGMQIPGADQKQSMA